MSEVADIISFRKPEIRDELKYKYWKADYEKIREELARKKTGKRS